MTTKTLYVENRAQAAIYECEMKGQLSDGRWENSRPMNHWHTPCEAVVVVRPENTGRDFWHMRGYNFGETELFSIVGERMTRFAQAAIAFPDVSMDVIAEHHWTFDDDVRTPHSYPSHAEKLEKMLAAFGVATTEEFEARLAATGYTQKQCKKDASKLTMCFRNFFGHDVSQIQL